MITRTFPGGSRITAQSRLVLGEGVRLGPDVIVECESARLGDHVAIGVETEDSFRRLGGVRIRVAELTVGKRSEIGRETLIKGGMIEFGRRVRIKAGATVHVTRVLKIGDFSTVHEETVIEGVDVVMGRQLWMLPHARIGGGSAFEPHSRLRIGDWCHLGMYSFINTARPVVIGDEVGLGMRTALYTHGAYGNFLDGFPCAFGEIRIGSRSWLPGAIVNPGVTIGADVVVGVGSVVTKDVSDGSLVMGAPARVLKTGVFPKEWNETRFALLHEFVNVFGEICEERHAVKRLDEGRGRALVIDACCLVCSPFPSPDAAAKLADEYSRMIWLGEGEEPPAVRPSHTIINIRARSVTGPADMLSERLLNQFRRYGVRFNYVAHEGRYVHWDDLSG